MSEVKEDAEGENPGKFMVEAELPEETLIELCVASLKKVRIRKNYKDEERHKGPEQKDRR